MGLGHHLNIVTLKQPPLTLVFNFIKVHSILNLLPQNKRAVPEKVDYIFINSDSLYCTNPYAAILAAAGMMAG